MGCLIAAAAACSGKERAATPVRPDYLFDVPYIAKSILVDTTGSPDTQQLVLICMQSADSVAKFYRAKLPPMGWSLLADRSDTAKLTLYFERHNLPLWIQIEPQDPSSSRVTFTASGGTPAGTSRPRL